MLQQVPTRRVGAGGSQQTQCCYRLNFDVEHVRCLLSVLASW